MRSRGVRRRLFRRRAFLHVLWIPVLLLPAVASADGGVQEQGSRLVARQPVLFRVARGGTNCLTFSSAAGMNPEILIETSAPGLAFEVHASDRRLIQAASSEYPEWSSLSFLADGRGEYGICARAQPSRVNEEAVSFRVELVPFTRTGADARAKAESLFASANPLYRSLKAADLQRAIDLYRQAGSAWATAGDREGQVLALACESQARLNLSEYDKAISALHRGAEIRVPEPFWNAWLSNLEAQVYLDRWNNAEARSYSEKALRLSRSLNDDWLAADILSDLAETKYLTHERTAKSDIERAILLARQSGATRTIARALRCAAWIEKDRGNLTRAFALLDQARENFHQDGDIRAELQAMATLATIESISGDLYSSLLRHTEIADLMLQAGYTAHHAILQENIGGEYELLNRVADASVYYDHALTEYTATGHQSGQAIAHFNLCSVLQQQNELHKALGHCEAGFAIVKTFHDNKRTATALWRLGNVQRALGNTDLASKSFRRAISLSKSVHDANFEARALLDLGEMLDASGEADEASNDLEEARNESELAGDVPLQAEAYYRIAHNDFNVGQDEMANASVERAIEKIESLRRKVVNADLQASYSAELRKCEGLKVEILMREWERKPASNASAQALEASESGRARTLLDSLAGRGIEPEADRQARASQALLELHAAVERAYDQRLKLLIDDGRKLDLDDNAAALTLAIDRLDRVEDGQKTSAGSSPAPQGRTLSTAEIAAASRKLRSTLIEYMLGQEQSYVWVIDDGTVQSYVLPPRKRIENAVGRWRALATARVPQPGEKFDERMKRVQAAEAELPRAGADLSCMLLAPFLKPGMRDLTIVPDGELALLPFAALPETGCQAPGQPIVVEHQVLLTPSLSIFLMPRIASEPAPARSEVAVLADPVFDRNDSRVSVAARGGNAAALGEFTPVLASLPGSGEEADEIIKIVGASRVADYRGFKASRQTLFDPSLRHYRILHLATHGVFDERRPEFSGIVLSLVDQDGKRVDGFLNTTDIAKLDLPFDLVVLSSCSSGEGVMLSSEGVTGLSHAFLMAGAKQVLSTLWSVEDTASKDLMAAFYATKPSDLLAPAAALRLSQLKIRSNPRTASPYYWAGFEISSTGNGPS